MGGVTLGIPGIITEFDVGLNNVVNGLISWVVLTLGVGVRFEISCHTNFRRTSSGLPRPFTSARDLCFSSFRSSLSQGQFGVRRLNHGPSLRAGRIVSALAFAACESLSAALEADLFFLHERGWWMGVYVIGLFGGVSLGGLISGFIINAKGWRWHFWVSYYCLSL